MSKVHYFIEKSLSDLGQRVKKTEVAYKTIYTFYRIGRNRHFKIIDAEVINNNDSIETHLRIATCSMNLLTDSTKNVIEPVNFKMCDTKPYGYNNYILDEMNSLVFFKRLSMAASNRNEIKNLIDQLKQANKLKISHLLYRYI